MRHIQTKKVSIYVVPLQNHKLLLETVIALRGHHRVWHRARSHSPNEVLYEAVHSEECRVIEAQVGLDRRQRDGGVRWRRPHLWRGRAHRGPRPRARRVRSDRGGRSPWSHRL